MTGAGLRTCDGLPVPPPVLARAASGFGSLLRLDMIEVLTFWDNTGLSTLPATARDVLTLEPAAATFLPPAGVTARTTPD